MSFWPEVLASPSSQSTSGGQAPSSTASEPTVKVTNDHYDEIQACFSCGKIANSTEAGQNSRSLAAGLNASEIDSNSKTVSRVESEKSLIELAVEDSCSSRIVTPAGGSGSTLEAGHKHATNTGSGGGKAHVHFRSKEQSAYLAAVAGTGKSVDEVKLTKSALMEDVANLDDVSQIPEKRSESKTEIFDPSTIPNQPRRRSGRKKWCCCYQKRKHKSNNREMSGGDQQAGMNNNHANNVDDATTVESNGFFQCLGSNTDESPEEDHGATSPRKSFHAGAQRRTRIPDRPNYSLSLWSILKNAVGKELTKVAMPVNFSEPLSMLQRVTEDYEYSSILDNAARATDAHTQMCYVAAFTISSYASTALRTGKPFNPLLGETFECDRKEDLGWKCISEQVSHHPPTAAFYCEGNGWTCWQEFTMSSKFRGNYLEIVPLGIAHLTFEDGNHYTWRKVTTTVHNLVLGKLWVEQAGDMVVTNHKTGDTCHLKYIPYSMFNRKQKEVVGTVVDRNGFIHWHINGAWDAKVDAWKRKAPKKLDAKASQKSMSTQMEEVTNGISLWKRKYPPPESEQYYNFTEFACQLNEMEEGVAPTDSRLRPDQRMMEQGDFDAANLEKVRLEEKQRAARKKFGGDESFYRPVWFAKEKDPVEGSMIHVYKGEYWNCKEAGDWKRCPDIF